MKFWNATFATKTHGGGEVVDLTDQLQGWIEAQGIEDGQGVLFVPGSTAALTTIEYEPGVIRDLQELLEALTPVGRSYHHDQAWGDGNGYAHVRAALLGPSLSLLVRGNRLIRGTWQQVVLCDFDNRPRRRVVEAQFVGMARDR